MGNGTLFWTRHNKDSVVLVKDRFTTNIQSCISRSIDSVVLFRVTRTLKHLTNKPKAYGNFVMVMLASSSEHIISGKSN